MEVMSFFSNRGKSGKLNLSGGTRNSDRLYNLVNNGLTIQDYNKILSNVRNINDCELIITDSLLDMTRESYLTFDDDNGIKEFGNILIGEFFRFGKKVMRSYSFGDKEVQSSSEETPLIGSDSKYCTVKSIFRNNVFICKRVYVYIDTRSDESGEARSFLST